MMQWIVYSLVGTTFRLVLVEAVVLVGAGALVRVKTLFEPAILAGAEALVEALMLFRTEPLLEIGASVRSQAAKR